MCENALTNKTFPASGGRGMSVRAPHNNSLLTASMSAAMMAKKITGIGIRDMLGSAPRSSSSFSVFRRTRCLVRQEHNTLRSLHRNTKPDRRQSSQQTENGTDSVFMAAILRTVSSVSEN